MIDCGEGTQIQMRRSKLKFSRLGHIFISHLHGDHCFGLIGLISTFNLLGRTADLHIHAPAPLGPMLEAELRLFCREMTYRVVFHAVETTTFAPVHSDRSVEVFSLPLRHRVPCCGYLFRERPTLPHIRRDMIDFYHIPTYALNDIKQGASWVTPEGEEVPASRLTTPAAPPRTYAYCSDTIFFPELCPLIEGVDLLFHEATFDDANLARARETFHSTASQAATIARDSHVGRLLIGHFSNRYDDESLLLHQAQAIFPQTLLAREGLCVEV